MSAVDDIAAYLAHFKTGGNRIDQIIFDELPIGEEMTATDELRRLLDERGVEHVDAEDGHTQHTLWSDGDHKICASNSGERLAVYNLTPEQAIEATLGGVPYSKPTMLSDLQAENAKLRELVRHLYMCLSFCDRGDEERGCGFCPYRSASENCEFEQRLLELGVEV